MIFVSEAVRVQEISVCQGHQDNLADLSLWIRYVGSQKQQGTTGQPQCNDSPTFWQIMYQFVAVYLVPKTLVLPKPPGQDQCVASTCPKVLLSLVLNSLALSHNKAVLHKRKTHSESSSAAGIQRMPLLCSSQVRSYLLKQVVLQLSWICQAGPTDNT